MAVWSTTVPFILIWVKGVMVALIPSPLLCPIATVLTTALAVLTTGVWFPALPSLISNRFDCPIRWTELTNTGRWRRVAKGLHCCSSSNTTTTPVRLWLPHSSSGKAEVWAIKEWAISFASRDSAGGFLTTEHLDREQRGQWMHFGQFRQPLKNWWSISAKIFQPKMVDCSIKPWCRAELQNSNLPTLESLTSLICSCCNVQ